MIQAGDHRLRGARLRGVMSGDDFSLNVPDASVRRLSSSLRLEAQPPLSRSAALAKSTLSTELSALSVLE